MDPSKGQNYSKLQVICSLFASSIGDDLYFAHQIKESIEAALPESERHSAAAFVQLAERLAKSTAAPENAGIGLVSVQEGQGFSLLSFRARLIAALKRTCRFERPLVVLDGLKEAICPRGKRWTPRHKLEYDEAIEYARTLCQQRTRPSSKLSLVIF